MFGAEKLCLLQLTLARHITDKNTSSDGNHNKKEHMVCLKKVAVHLIRQTKGFLSYFLT